MITIIRDQKTNKVNFYMDGDKVYPLNVRGNIAEFSNGQLILF